MKNSIDMNTIKEQIYQFELSRVGIARWIAVKIEPLPPQAYQVNDIIPPSIIDQIVAYPVDPEKIHNYKTGVDDSVKEKYYTVEFIKYSDDHLFGTIRQYAIQEEKILPEFDRPRIIKVDWNYEKNGDQKNYRELIAYMEKYPEIKNHIFGEFFHRVKPRLGNRSNKAS